MINLISRDNNAGLSRDLRIIRDLLTDNDIQSRIIDIDGDRGNYPADVNIFLEIVDNHYISHADVNLFIPNPEWYLPRWTPVLKRQFDLILTKTKDATQAFQPIGDTEFISFTSRDRYIESVKRRKDFCHMPGVSSTKGTDRVVEAWQEDYPQLRIIAGKNVIGRKVEQSNINHTVGLVGEKDHKKEQNKHLIHVCPSGYEGFGHYINEARSAKGVVVTMDCPPMTELIDEEIGFLIKPREREAMNLGTVCKPNSRLIRKVIDRVIDTDKSDLKEMGEKARKRYLDNDKFFRQKFMKVISDVYPG